MVSWSGSDNPGGSGLATYTEYVSDNGGLFSPLLTRTTETSATFSGLNGHTYGFYSVATDHVGNQQPASSAQATTTVDSASPTSSVSALPSIESSLAFPITVNANDPQPAPGVPPSGLASVDIYVSMDSGPFTLWKNLALTGLTGSVTTTYPAQSSHSYAFASLAHDQVGNIESKILSADTGTSVPDLNPPSTAVVSVNPIASPPTPILQVNFSSAASGGSGLASFAIYAEVDGGAPVLIGTVPGGTPVGGVYSGSLSYLPIADGVSHTYGFYTVGTNGHGVSETKTNPDFTYTATFTAPPTLSVIGLTVQHGAAERSFVRYVDINFNESDAQSGGALTALMNSLTSGTAHIALIQHDLGYNGATDTAGTPVPLSASMLHVVDHAIEIDFGQYGLGGVSAAGLSLINYWSELTQGDGYYELDLNLNPTDNSGTLPIHELLYRLLGDVTGDGVVNGDLANPNSDASLVKAAQNFSGQMAAPFDVNGDGTVNTVDYFLVTRSNARKIAGVVKLNG